jgi:hypothetical protein
MTRFFKTDPEKWAATRQLGRDAFVWRYGVLGWGISTGVLFAVVEGVQHGMQAGLVQLPIALTMFPLAGVLWGRAMWWFFERVHERAASE